MTDRDFEAEAKAEGWVPQEEWQGDPDKWVPAQTFVERGEEILPIVNAKNRKLTETVETLQKTVDELKLGNEQFREFHDKTLAKEREKRDQLIQELEAARQKAIEDGDGKAFSEADKTLNEMRTAKQEEPKGHENPVVKAWLSDNQWYESDESLQAIADGLSTVLARQRPDLVGKREFLDELTKRVQKEVPHKFENPNRNRSTTEDVPPKGKAKGKTLDDMPPEDRASFERFSQTIPGFNLDEAVKSYFA